MINIKKNNKHSNLILRFTKTIFPQVNNELNVWIKKCSKIEDRVLKELALSSIYNKKFHCQGGSFYSLYPNTNIDSTVKFIVAFQTISDYLDNLCDMAGVYNEKAFRQLHRAMLDAVDIKSGLHDYYKYYTYDNDNGYLNSLVGVCREQIKELKSYDIVAEPMKKYIQLYTDLQSLKHLERSVREERLQSWAQSYAMKYPKISGWEFSAATGSTLGVFFLFAAAYNSSLTTNEVTAIDKAYFPWVCGLHILLDYYIDFDEDQLTKELNFTSYYSNLEQCAERLSFFIKNSYGECKSLKYPRFHYTIIRGLLAMYLSDAKALTSRNKSTTKHLLRRGGRKAIIYYHLCRLLRRFNKL